MITRIIKAMLLAALGSLCLANASIVHAHGGDGGGNRQDRNDGWNPQGRNGGGNGRGAKSGYEAPELNSSALGGSMAVLAAILLLGRHRREELKTESDLPGPAIDG